MCKPNAEGVVGLYHAFAFDDAGDEGAEDEDEISPNLRAAFCSAALSALSVRGETGSV